MSRSTTGPVRPPGHAYRHAYGHGQDVVFSSPTGCSFRSELEGLKNLDSPSREGTFVISHADRADHYSRIRV